MMFIKVEVDQEECTACGVCYNEECSTIFEGDADGLARIVEKYRIGEPTEGAVPLELRSCVESAALQCPTDAINFFELEKMPEDEAVGY